MMCQIKQYVEQEMEDLYVSVVQILKDTGIKLNDEIEPDLSFGVFDRDINLKKPYWIRYTKQGGWVRTPRNVILK